MPEFLHSYFLRHPAARKYLEQKAKGAIMSGLNMGIIKDMPVPLAPIDLQREFVRRLKSIQSMVRAQLTSLSALDSLVCSLRHRAFHGQL